MAGEWFITEAELNALTNIDQKVKTAPITTALTAIKADDKTVFQTKVTDALNKAKGKSALTDIAKTDAIKAIVTAVEKKVTVSNPPPETDLKWLLSQEDLTALASDPNNQANFTDPIKTALTNSVVGKIKAADEAAFNTAVTEALKAVTDSQKTDAIKAVVAKVKEKVTSGSPPSTPSTSFKLTQAMLDELAKDDAATFTQEVVNALKAVVDKPHADETAFKQAVTTALPSSIVDPQKKNIIDKSLAKAKAAPSPTPSPASLPTGGGASKIASMFSASLDVSYSRKWGFDMTASSKVTAKIVAIPAPQPFLDALEDARAGQAKEENE